MDCPCTDLNFVLGREIWEDSELKKKKKKKRKEAC